MHALACAAIAAAFPIRTHAHGNVGPVQPPLKMPALPVTTQDGRQVSLPSLLHGKATALQLMFTGCSEICPLQGALFSEVQTALTKHPAANIQLVSISIDALGDTAAALQAWLRKFDAGKNWLAAVPAVKDVDPLRELLEQATGPADNHGGQVFLFDKHGMLVWRMENLPPPHMIVKQLLRIEKAN